ncbi:MAG: glycogen debranching enzyme, partial [Treponema sp.]|nr:glycogen debranching enzyme [Treponema sp.]
SNDSWPDIQWFDSEGQTPNWSKSNHFFAYLLDGSRAEIYSDKDDNDFFIMINGGKTDITVKLPKLPENKKWYRAIDTSVESPADIFADGYEELLINQNVYIMQYRASCVLLAK